MVVGIAVGSLVVAVGALLFMNRDVLVERLRRDLPSSGDAAMGSRMPAVLANLAGAMFAGMGLVVIALAVLLNLEL